jgi:hypothetical protein
MNECEGEGASRLARKVWLALHEGTKRQGSALNDVEFLAAAQLPSASKRFGAFRIQEEAQLAAEEALLESLLEASSDLDRQVVATVRRAHDDLRQRMEATAYALGSGHVDAAVDAVRGLRYEIQLHEQTVLELVPALLEGRGTRLSRSTSSHDR